MKAKFIYESLTDVFKPKSWGEIQRNIESKGEPNFDYWYNVIIEFDKLMDGKLQCSIVDWEFNKSMKWRAIELDTWIGKVTFVIDWSMSTKDEPIINVDFGKSTRNFLGPIALPDNPKELAEIILEKIREQNQTEARPAHSFKRKSPSSQ